MNLEKAINSRKSVRVYLNKPVEDDKLKQVLLAGNNAPSAMNNQDRVFIAIKGDAMKNRLNAIIEKSVSAETRDRIKSRSQDGTFNFFYKAPVLIVVASSNDLYPEADCACAIQNIYLRANDLGLSACWINQLTKTTNADVLKALQKVGMSENCAVYGCLALGYSDDKTPKKVKTNKIIIVK